MSIHGIADQDTISRYDKKIDKSKYCQSLHICINKKVDKKYPTYGGASNLTVFERLSKFKDIVDITYLDGNKNILESICVPLFLIQEINSVIKHNLNLPFLK